MWIQKLLSRYIGSPKLAGDLVPRCCKIADDSDEATLHDVFTNEVGQPICLSIQNYWEMNPQADLADIVSLMEPLTAIQKTSRQQAIVDKPSNTSGKVYYKKPWAKL